MARLQTFRCILGMFRFNMLIFKHLLFTDAVMYNLSMLIVGMVATRELCTIHHIWHALKYYICLIKQNLFTIYLFSFNYSCIMLLTSLSEDCGVCGKGFKRLGAHLARSLACCSYFMPRRADTEECCHGNANSNVSEDADHGTRPNLRSSLYSTLFRARRATARGEAEDNLPIINANMGRLPKIPK
jgi:hypothetical protein